MADLHIREAASGEESRTIEGYALKFGVRSRLLCDWWDYASPVKCLTGRI